MSNHLQSVQLIMQTLGPSTPEIDAIIQSEESSWALQFADESVIVIDWADNPPRLVLSATLGRPAEDARLAVYQALLSYNLLWKETGGLKTALAGKLGEVVLFLELYSDPLYDTELRRVLLELVKVASVWRNYVAAEGAPQGQAQIDSDNMHLRA
ncbi:MAG: type III secretion system chaperone [Janthinobacterium lividum]